MTIIFSIVLDNQDADRHHLDISLNLQFLFPLCLILVNSTIMYLALKPEIF